MLKLISLIITTYNWPTALAKVLAALNKQTSTHFEVIIADDGSRQDTADYICRLQASCPYVIRHVWQADEGFQAAKIRNKAAAVAKGDYLIFLDGDCLPLKSFIQRHLQLAEEGWFVAGNRILFSERYTKIMLKDEIDINTFSLFQWLTLKYTGHCNRWLPLLFLPFYPRKCQPLKWQGAKTCNLGVWKKDFYHINGFDETFTGWGYEDSDLVIRLIHAGIKRKEGRFSIPVLHLWHKEQDRREEPQNLTRFKKRLTQKLIQVPQGVNQWRILE